MDGCRAPACAKLTWQAPAQGISSEGSWQGMGRSVGRSVMFQAGVGSAEPWGCARGVSGAAGDRLKPEIQDETRGDCRRRSPPCAVGLGPCRKTNGVYRSSPGSGRWPQRAAYGCDAGQNAWVSACKQCRGGGGARGWGLQLREDVKFGFEVVWWLFGFFS